MGMPSLADAISRAWRTPGPYVNQWGTSRVHGLSVLWLEPRSGQPSTEVHCTRPAKTAAEQSVTMADAICAGEPRPATRTPLPRAMLSFALQQALRGLHIHSLATPALAARVLNSPHVRLLPVDFLQASAGGHFHHPHARAPGGSNQSCWSSSLLEQGAQLPRLARAEPVRSRELTACPPALRHALPPRPTGIAFFASPVHTPPVPWALSDLLTDACSLLSRCLAAGKLPGDHPGCLLYTSPSPRDS